MAGMVTKLGSLAKKRLIISFAPKTWYYDILKKVRPPKPIHIIPASCCLVRRASSVGY